MHVYTSVLGMEALHAKHKRPNLLHLGTCYLHLKEKKKSMQSRDSSPAVEKKQEAFILSALISLI